MAKENKFEDKLFYSVKTVSEVAELHENTVKNYIYDKKLKAYKVGKVWRIAKDDLIDFIKSQPSNLDEDVEANEKSDK